MIQAALYNRFGKNMPSVGQLQFYMKMDQSSLKRT
ncbi:hypothetical protein P872_11525 [Rhodonellum psychrophilum GCM71 = DSM 17998]|uniref:Uncharacterized protein n=2 Tax=Rhodonellum TaxID=336827 RepID=U5BKN5_9BACT|nr:hypothetical protein P872_11525 [Rhodonellum psychrophilum GCM71 = DSM 17998]